MFRRNKLFIGSMLSFIPMVTIAQQPTTHVALFTPSKAYVAKVLRWVPYADCSKHLCDGYYLYNPLLTAYPNPPSMGHTATIISSKGPSNLLPNGVSVLKDQVKLSQKGRLITADKAYVKRNNHTGKITQVELFGHVHDETAKHLVVCPYAKINLEKHLGYFKHGIMRTKYHSKKDGVLTSWGTATTIHRHADGDISLQKKLQLSFCSPLHPTWVIHADHGMIYRAKNKIKFYNAVITFHHVPIFMTPYFSLTLNKKRKTGVLFPKIGYGSKNGFHIAVPYYFNIAPNYDDYWINGWYSKRGYYLKNKFRWLTTKMHGQMSVFWLPHDTGFAAFRNALYPSLNPTDITKYPYYHALQNDSLSRYQFKLNNAITFNPYWTSDLIVNHVSDDYFLNDFSNFVESGMLEPNQLLNLADLKYQGLANQFSLQGVSYQALHPWGNSADNEYNQISASDHWFVAKQRFSVNFNNNVTDFIMPNNLFSTPLAPINKLVDGIRFHSRESIVIPWTTSAGYVRTTLAGDLLSDQISYKNPVAVTSGDASGVMPAQVTRALPIINVDSALYFINRHLFHAKQLSATLKPELSYLYIPYKNQQTLPVFDTIALPLTYDTLFNTNSFVGVDRIQNANQVAAGVQASLFNSDSGYQYATIGLGAQYFFTPQKVQLTYQQPLTPNNHHLSNIVSEVNVMPTSPFSATLDAGWDTYHHRLDSSSFEMSYYPTSKFRLMASYDYLATTIDEMGNELGPANDYYTLGVAAPIGTHLEAFTYQYYDADNEHMLGGLEGFQYDSCCWALRLAYSHQWSGTVTNNDNQTVNSYDNTVYVEFILKGLGSFGTKLDALLNADFNGYNYR